MNDLNFIWGDYMHMTSWQLHGLLGRGDYMAYWGTTCIGQLAAEGTTWPTGGLHGYWEDYMAYVRGGA